MLVNQILFVLPLVWTLANVYGDTRIITTGLWTKTDTGCGYYTSTLNGSVSLTFNGVSIHVLGDLSLYGGIVQITLDGQPARLIDLYGAASCGQELFSSTGLANVQHSINLKLTGESPNIKSTDGPARLFVFTKFIWSVAPNSSSSLSLSLPTEPPSPPPPSTGIIWASKRQLPSQPSPPPPPPTSQPLPPPPTTPPPPPLTTAPPPLTTSEPPLTTQPPSTTSQISSPLSPSSPPAPSSSESSPSSPSSPSPPSSPSSSLSLSSSVSPSSLPSSLSLSSLSSPSSPSSHSASPSTSEPPLTSTPSPTPSSTSSKLPPLPPTSTLSSESVPTVTAVASGPTQDLSKVQGLWTCKPYGPNDCTFKINPQFEVAVEHNTYALIVGASTSNCEGTSSSNAEVGGQLTITDTWSQDLNVGLSLGGSASNLVLNTSGTQVWENSKSRFLSRVLKMTIPPANQGALVAQVSYISTIGTMQIGNESPFPVRANQPQNEVQYLANIVPCGAQFKGNSTPNPTFGPSVSAAQSMKPYGHGIMVIVALSVRILL